MKLNPRLFTARLALARLLLQQGDLKKAVLLTNIGILYHYPYFIDGLDKFYQYAVRLNLMNGDADAVFGSRLILKVQFFIFYYFLYHY